MKSLTYVLCYTANGWSTFLVSLTASIFLLLFSPDAPQVTIVGYDNNWYVGRTNVLLTCEAKGNPTPTMVEWKTWVLPFHLSNDWVLCFLPTSTVPPSASLQVISFHLQPFTSRVLIAAVNAFFALRSDHRDYHPIFTPYWTLRLEV